ncbi:hypothetical protein GBA65_19265 [Rubrobacter marinus]|uniref:Uncharacterized protein n=1 Tax=Rubrobacter marinus TaxID=2653852 RepID=A0A6G8Q1G0_9ACTN|nr:hypothetical protein [Rubrobacter marinus]QIN80303.1 hypothetical protein GBA65_19265 [Rubrobacter marinus]
MEGSAQRARFFARYYADLQGLKKVPIGLVFLAIATGNAGLWPWFELWEPISGALVLGAGFALSWAIGRYYYGRAFGRVRRRPGIVRHGAAVTVAGLAVLVLMFVDAALLPPVSTMGLAIAAWLFAWCHEGGRRMAHYGVAGALFALASFLPLTGWVSPDDFFAVVLPALFGLVVLAGGFYDHRMLAQAMRPTVDEW